MLGLAGHQDADEAGGGSAYSGQLMSKRTPGSMMSSFSLRTEYAAHGGPSASDCGLSGGDAVEDSIPIELLRNVTSLPHDLKYLTKNFLVVTQLIDCELLYSLSSRDPFDQNTVDQLNVD